MFNFNRISLALYKCLIRMEVHLCRTADRPSLGGRGTRWAGWYNSHACSLVASCTARKCFLASQGSSWEVLGGALVWNEMEVSMKMKLQRGGSRKRNARAMTYIHAPELLHVPCTQP